MAFGDGQIDSYDLSIGGGAVMHLRPSEVASVARGLAASGGVAEGATPVAVAAALSTLDERDRAPAWELAVRHLARGKPLVVAAAEIGMDSVRAEALKARLVAGRRAGAA